MKVQIKTSKLKKGRNNAIKAEKQYPLVRITGFNASKHFLCTMTAKWKSRMSFHFSEPQKKFLNRSSAPLIERAFIFTIG